MDRLFHCAQRGDVEELHKLLEDQPLILDHMPIACTENPLHFSCAAGHFDFTKTVLELKPDLARELNTHCYSPLHLASANGKIEIVKEIIRVDPNICHLSGREGYTPLHTAVVRGKVDVISVILEKCEGCLEDLTFQKETALHLAVKNLQFGSLKVMVEWIMRKNLADILNQKDEHGNTILHLVVWKKQRQRGDVQELHRLLEDQPLILHHVPIACSENPLHFSCAAGHFDFTKTVLELKPDLAGELNAHGYSPLHLASANGKIEIVKEIIRVDSSICHLSGREGYTPLHAAVVRGKVDVISEILEKCEESLEDVTFQKETALHLAVKNLQFGSLKVMVDWIRRKNLGDILNQKDEHGNTILHLAVWKKQRQFLDLLVERCPGLLEVNVINSSGLTALDLLLIFPSEAGDRELQEILQGAGALKARDLELHNTTHSRNAHDTPGNSNTSSNLIEYFKFHAGRDAPSDVRSTLLVIAVLVVTATYQVGVSPPGGTWQDDQRGHVAGTSILGSHNLSYYVLLVGFNSLGFNVSLYMIAILTSKFPLSVDLRVLLCSLFFTFNLTTVATSPNDSRLSVIIITAVLPTVVPLTGNLLRKYEIAKCLLGMFQRRRLN